MKTICTLAAAGALALSAPAWAGDASGGCMGYHQVVEAPATASAGSAGRAAAPKAAVESLVRTAGAAQPEG